MAKECKHKDKVFIGSNIYNCLDCQVQFERRLDNDGVYQLWNLTTGKEVSTNDDEPTATS